MGGGKKRPWSLAEVPESVLLLALSAAPVKAAAFSCIQAAFLASCHYFSMDLYTKEGKDLIF